MVKVAVIGGGAAGMMAAVTAMLKGAEVTLIERNVDLGRKVKISGGGRCNVTTGFQDLNEVLKKYPRGSKFLRNAMYNFSPIDVYQWFENQGVRLKTEGDMRVFPASDNGADVVKVFENLLLSGRAKILNKNVVQKIIVEGEGFKIYLESGSVIADKVILTAGGQAYRHTGSRGDGYKLAEDLGHSVTELAPSLNAFVLAESWVKELAGVSFENVRLRLVKDKRHEFNGPILFTHKGVTGPAVFALSSLSAYEKYGKNDPAKLYIDFVLGKTYEQLHQALTKAISDSPKKSFYNTLAFISGVPRSFAKMVYSEDRMNAEVSKKDINKSVELLKNMELNIIGNSAGDEFVTAGGIKLSEVDPKTMASKICPGLFFAGEILDIDGFTGGFNLQAAWCTGMLSGQNAVRNE